MLSLPMAYYDHRLKSVVMFGTNWKCNKIHQEYFASFLIKRKEPNLDDIQLCSPDQSKSNSCFGNDQYTVCAMNKNETTHKLSFTISSMFIHLLINKPTRDHWRIGNCAGTTMDIMVMQSI